MDKKDRFITEINRKIRDSDNSVIRELYPLTHDRIIGNSDICALLIDYFGDIYVVKGLDKNYSENETGEKLSELIDYLIRCNNIESCNLNDLTEKDRSDMGG